MIRSETELWGTIADTLEMIKSMPPCAPSDGSPWNNTPPQCAGLCAVLVVMYLDGLVSKKLRTQALRRIDAKARRSPVRNGCYLFKPWDWRPRVGLARHFAKRSSKS